MTFDTSAYCWSTDICIYLLGWKDIVTFLQTNFHWKQPRWPRQGSTYRSLLTSGSSFGSDKLNTHVVHLLTGGACPSCLMNDVCEMGMSVKIPVIVKELMPKLAVEKLRIKIMESSWSCTDSKRHAITSGIYALHNNYIFPVCLWKRKRLEKLPPHPKKI